jgi:hypothetical protein
MSIVIAQGLQAKRIQQDQIPNIKNQFNKITKLQQIKIFTEEEYLRAKQLSVKKLSKLIQK